VRPLSAPASERERDRRRRRRALYARRAAAAGGVVLLLRAEGGGGRRCGGREGEEKAAEEDGNEGLGFTGWGMGWGVRPGGVVGGGSRKTRTLPLRGLPGRHVPPGARREEQKGQVLIYPIAAYYCTSLWEPWPKQLEPLFAARRWPI
jgi:hypothetical protein